MTVTSVEKDPVALTLTITSELAAPVDRAWQLWTDPRQLERWWGPPTYPATFVDHDLSPGARVSYFMTGPSGDKAYGYWDVVAVDPPHRLEVRDGFADDSGEPTDTPGPGVMIVTLTETADGAGTVMVIESQFPSAAEMEQLLAMGQEEGMVAALSQIEAILADTA
ncbi:MAG: SRPBCC domain-containing protein [Acidimicrobiia bacterium]|nr:SRPBCC domain-containing protein [Acidimicrobiia bacterium]